MTIKRLISNVLAGITSQAEYFNRLFISMLTDLSPLFLIPGILLFIGCAGSVITLFTIK